jgi:hypothetical protein
MSIKSTHCANCRLRFRGGFIDWPDANGVFYKKRRGTSRATPGGTLCLDCMRVGNATSPNNRSAYMVQAHESRQANPCACGAFVAGTSSNRDGSDGLGSHEYHEKDGCEAGEGTTAHSDGSVERAS